MTTLQTLISQISNLSDATSVYHELVDKIQKTIVYTGPQSIASIEKTYGSEFAVMLVAGMKAVLAGLRETGTAQNIATADYLSIYFDRVTLGDGLDFSDDSVRLRLDILVPYLGQDVVDKLKALGSVMKSKWELNSQDIEPTLAEVQAAVQVELSRRATKEWVSYVKAILANDGNGKTISELKALIAERQ